MKKIYILQKHSNKVLVVDDNNNPILNQYEVDCKCKNEICRTTLISEENLTSFRRTRLGFGSPVKANSCYRCMLHNKAVGGVLDSSHTKGDGIDLEPLNGDLDGLEIEARKHYKYVLRYPTFIHCDNRLHKELLK